MTSAAGSAIGAVRRRSGPGVLSATGVDVHFQPAATTSSGSPTLLQLLADGCWRTQFETGTSNGGLTAFSGGDRWRWESRLFDGAYDDALPEQRPVYGALRRVDDPYGAAPRFGSAHLRVRADVLERTTLCFPDSVFEPDAVGTVDAAGAILAALEAVHLEDPLDRYVEAHVHGGIVLQEDVEALVLDPSFRGTAVGSAAEAAGVRVEWHPGYALDPDRLTDLAAYRGADVAAAALRIAAGGRLTPAVLSASLAAGDIDPLRAKRAWHLLAAFGRLR